METCISDQQMNSGDIHQMNGNNENPGAAGVPTTTSSGQTFNGQQQSMSRGRSKVWNEFVVTADGKKVTCRQCGDSLSYSHSHSTSSMLKHLKRKHNMDLYPPVTEDDPLIDNSTTSASNKSPAEKSQKKYPKSKKSSAAATATASKPEESFVEQKVEPELSPSVQHDPLVFADPCVRMRWADHSDTVLKTFSVMYNAENYTDCVLVAEKQFFKGHRMILSSASELLDEMFKMTPPNQHPIIFLKDVKAMELRILLDFIYKGEVSIPPSHIPSLVKVGSELKVRGLSDFVWNDQLASSIFQGFQNNCSQFSQQQQPVQEQTFTSNNGTSQMQGATTMQQQQANSNLISARTSVLNKSQEHHHNNTTQQLGTTYAYMPEKPVQTSGYAVSQAATGPTRTYARLSSSVLSNIRSLNVIPSQQNLSLSHNNDGTSLVNSGGTEYKRIRLVTTGTPISTVKTNNTTYPAKFTTTSTGDISMDCEQIPETVLMVTNEGETLLSTSQGGVTLMAPNSISLPMNISVKNERTSLDSSNLHQYHHGESHHHPITILSSCGTSDTQDLEEVVYSITEVPGGGHEVLMSGSNDSMSSESIVMYSHPAVSNCETQEKKPFSHNLHKS